jgi:hypothetical protein
MVTTSLILASTASDLKSLSGSAGLLLVYSCADAVDVINMRKEKTKSLLIML